MDAQTASQVVEDIRSIKTSLRLIQGVLLCWWPEHVVDEKGMTLLQKAYEKVMGASVAVTFLKKHLVRLEQGKGGR